MWAALKSDFTEVISGIKDESSTAINSVTLAMNEDGTGKTANTEEENIYENDQDVVLDDGMVFHHAKDGESMFEQTGIVSNPADEVALLRDSEETYIQPLVPSEVNGKDSSYECSENETVQNQHTSDDTDDYIDENLYLEQFKIEDMTEEIADILKKYPNTVEIHFNSLVPEVVTYTQFWQRYFYRCNLSRVEKRWQDEAYMREKERKEMIQKGVQTVTNLFGGAMKNLGRVVAPQTDVENESTYEKYQKRLQEQNEILSRSNETSPAPPFSLFGSSGRPPFVMNTADSSDEGVGKDVVKKVIEETEVEEDEEELGWDSDEEDYDEEDDEEQSQMIEFQSPGNASLTKDSWQSEKENLSKEVDKLREQLEIILEERNSLQRAIEMQTKELTEMKLLKKSSSSDDGNNLEHQVQKLEMKIFERDSELAALKASLDDTLDGNNISRNSDNLDVLEKELETLKTEIKCRDEKILKLTDDTDKLKNEIKNVKTQLAVREEELISTKSNLGEAKQQRDEITKALKLEKDHFILEHKKMLEKNEFQEEEIFELRLLIESSNKTKLELEKDMNDMKGKIDLLEKKSMEKLVSEDHANETNSGSNGSSSAVHVPLKSAITNDNNDDDDWGDEW